MGTRRCNSYKACHALTSGRRAVSFPSTSLYPDDGRGATPPLHSPRTSRQSEGKICVTHTHTHTHTEATPTAPLTFIQTRPCRHHAQLQQPDGRGGPEVQVEHQLTSKRSTEQVPGGRSGLGQKQHTMQGHVYTDWTIASSPPSLHNSLAPPYFTVGTEFTMQYSNNFLSLHCPYIYIYIIIITKSFLWGFLEKPRTGINH